MENKVIVITGASAGIGAALAERLGSEGASMVLVARRQDALNDAASRSGARVLAVVADVTVRDDVRRVVNDAIQRFGHIDVWVNTPEWVHLAPLPAGGRTIRFPVLNDELSLLWAINMGCIDLNVWCAREDLPERPDVVIFDLDPAAPASFDEARQVALLVRDVLASVDLRAYPRTSGSIRGLHVLVPIARRHSHGEARELVAAVGAALEHTHPGLVTTKWAKTERKGVLIDANQNGYGRTTAWAYSVRPRPVALVATPVTWEELEQPLDNTVFTMDAVQQRVARLGDLHRPVLEDAQSLGKALKALR